MNSPLGDYICAEIILYYYHNMWKQHNHWNFSLPHDQMIGESEYEAEVVFQIHRCIPRGFPLQKPTPAHRWKVAYRFEWTDKQRGSSESVFFFPPRQPVTGGQPALLDWTGAGILGVAAQHWPFTELPFSSARVKRSAGARGERREDVGENEGQKVGERWGSKEGVACSCVKSALCSFKIRFFFLSLFLCAIA